MTTSTEIVASALGIAPERADRLVTTLRNVGGRNALRWISISDVVEEAEEDPETVRKAVSALLLTFRLVAKYEPYHRECEEPIGPSEASVTKIEDKVSNEEYPRLHRCGGSIESMDDVVIRVRAFLPEGGL